MGEALAEVEAGAIAYLTRSGRPVAALVPVAELVELQSASDSAAIAAAAVRARPGPQVPHDVVEAMMAADDVTHDAMAAALDAWVGQDVSAGEVRARWESIRARRGE